MKSEIKSASSSLSETSVKLDRSSQALIISLMCFLLLLGCKRSESPKNEEQTTQKLSFERADLNAIRDPSDPNDAKKQPLGIDGFYEIKTIESLTFSPDGQSVLFTVVVNDLRKGKRISNIYRILLNEALQIKLTKGESNNSNPMWAPDGKLFYFVSNRSGTSQLWRMPIAGGEPTQITNLSFEVTSPIISPDGKKIAFVSSVFPEYGADDKQNAALAKDMEASPTKAHIADNLLYRHWTDWADGKRSHIMVLDIAGGKITDITPGDFESPVWTLDGGQFAFSPDSKEICFSGNREPPDAQAWTTNADLYVVSVDGGPARCLTKDNQAFDGSPSYSPGGKYIAFKKQTLLDYESDRWRIALFDRTTGNTTTLTEEFDNSVGEFTWSTDAGSIVFSSEVKGRVPLFKLNIETLKIEELGNIPSMRSFALSKSGDIAFVFERIDRPQELYAANIKGGEARRLTRFNDALVAEYDIRPYEEAWFDAPGGRKIHTFIVKPHGFRQGVKYPLILNVHGGPQNQWENRLRGDWQIYPAAGYVVAFCNPTGSTGYGYEFTAAISKDWGGKVYEDLMAVTDALLSLDYIDANRMGIMGWSYGGYMVNWIIGNTDRFKAAASMMGIFDLDSFHMSTEELWFPEWDIGGTPWDNPESYEQWNPARLIKNMKTPTLIVTGEKDFRIPYTQSLMLFTALKRRGVPSRLIVFPNDGHWPNPVKSMPLYYAAHLDWFHRYLGGEESPYDIKQMVRNRAF